MPFAIRYNAASQLALSDLNKETSDACKSLKKVSEGQKITAAQDAVADYTVSEKMQTQIRSLNQDKANIQNGAAMLKIASGGVESIIEFLRDLRELAINAATDTNTDDDRAILQKKADQILFSINDTATTTNYNGKNLLDGSISPTVQAVTTATQTKTVYTTVDTTTTVESTTSTASTEPITINTGDYITKDGIYSIASDFTGTLNISAKNVKITSNGSTLTNTQINVTAGNANLWIEDLNINNDNGSTIRFGYGPNTLIVNGNNSLTCSGTSGISAATINIGGGLNVIGSGTISVINADACIGTDKKQSSSSNINIGGSVTITANSLSGAGIGSGYQGSVGNITIGDNANVTANSGSGAGIGSGWYGSAGDIIIGNTANVTATSEYGAGIGSGENGSAKNITIGDTANVTANSGNGAGIGAGSGYSGSAGNITIGNTATVTANSSRGAGIGSGWNGSAGNIIIGNTANVTATSEYGAGIGSGYDSNSSAGNITISTNANVTANSNYGAGIGSGLSGSVGTITQNVANLETNLNLPTLTAPAAPTNTVTTTETVEVATTTTVAETVTETVEIPASFSSNFVFHTGDRAGQSLKFSIGDMHTKSLKSKVPSEADNAHLLNLQNDADKYTAFQELLDEVQNLTLDDLNLRTRESANKAIRLVEGALEYALNEAANIGAYLQRLERTELNITDAAEHTQAANSTIRDADMAREMSNYTKANVLSQAAQAVLAQANQNGGQVLGLLR